MKHITVNDLNRVIRSINDITGSPQEPYDAKHDPQAGCYYLYETYGGVCLHRMSLLQGCTSVTTPLGWGCRPKRALFNELIAYYAGLVELLEAEATTP